MFTHLELGKTVKKYTGTGGFYCCIEPTESSKKTIVEWCEENLKLSSTGNKNIFNQKNELHCTIMYSKERSPAGIVQTNGLIRATAYSLALFGLEQDTLVLLLHSRTLEDMYHKWVALNCKSSYPTYRPHITLADKIPEKYLDSLDFKYQLEELKEKLHANPIACYFEGEILEDIKEK